jgi:2-C-methyl-D-erythritol 2,4-cyclodiphosphate synthase
VVADLGADGWEVCNVDCSVVLEEPRLAPHREEMQRRLGEVVGAPVGVRGRRAESLGPVGRGEAVVCLAVALIRRR